jgi:hypothetical protein
MNKKIATTLAGLTLACAIGAQAAAPPSPQGAITAKGFLNISGTAVTDLTGNANFPNNPDVVYYYSYFEWNATGDINTAANNGYGENYGAQMLGYFYPPATGDYVFIICADDNADLYLSSDDTTANKKLIAQETVWSNPRTWDSAGSGAVEPKNSSTFAGTQWPTKDPSLGGAKITLTKGKAYYIEALMKEGGGGDNLAVAVIDPSSTIDGSLPIPGAYLSTIDKTAGPVTIKTAPQNVTVREGQSATFTVEADGTPPYTYQWKKNGTDIAGATNAKYVIDRVARGDNGAKFSVSVTGAQGSPVTAEATLTVTFDDQVPTLVSAAGDVSFTSITVTFSEPMNQASAETAANYKLSGGVTISAAKLAGAPGTANDNKVILTTSKQSEGATLTLTVSNVKDVAGNTIAANSTAEFKTLMFAVGAVMHKFWDNVTANSIAGLTGDARFPDAPTTITFEPMWEWPADGGNEGGSNYGNQLLGWFLPARDGDYIFFTCSDDPSDLYLSTDADPANKKLIARETGWSGSRNWVSTGSGAVEDKRSDTFSGSEWSPPNVISLKKGQRYYMESLHTEGGGGDNVGATFIIAGEADPATGDAPKLTGALIGTYMDPTGAKIDITQQPQSVTTAANSTATFTVAATGTSMYGDTLTYQWEKATSGSGSFAPIAGATTASYTTPFLAAADNGSKYRVIIYRPPLTTTSAEATLTISSDTLLPTVASVDGNPNQLELTLHFSEPLDAASATALANYAFDKGLTISSATLQNTKDVVLKTSQQTEGTDYTLTVNNVKDLAGNAVTANTKVAFKPATIATGAVAYWNFDGDLKDWVKNFHGTARGSAPIPFVDGKAGFGKAIKLDGNNQFVEITGGNENELEFPGGSMSIAGWFKVAAFDTDWQALIAKGEGTSWRVARRGSGQAVAYAGGVGEGADDAPPVDDGAWHHFVAISDATAAAFGTCMYIDGVQCGIMETAPVISANNLNVMIGENPGARSREWEGELDDIAIWNRVLLPGEVAKLYAAGAGKPLGTFLPPRSVEQPKMTVSRSADNLTIGWSPAGGTLEVCPAIAPTPAWTPVGTANPATVPITGSANYYRVRN